MNIYQHADGLVISLANSYYFVQKAFNNNLKNLLALIIANYGFKTGSFERQDLNNDLRLNIGTAVFPSNDIFSGENFIYEIQLDSGLTKKYVVIHYDPVYSNYQTNIYQPNNYVLENPGLTIHQLTNIQAYDAFKTMKMYSYTVNISSLSSEEPEYNIEDIRRLLSIYLEKPFVLSRQTDEPSYKLTTQNYQFYQSPIFYGLEKLSLNGNVVYEIEDYLGYFAEFSKDGYSFMSAVWPRYGVLPLNNICIAPMKNYNFAIQKRNMQNYGDYKDLTLNDAMAGNATISSVNIYDSYKTPFTLFYIEADGILRPSRILHKIQTGNKQTLINTTPNDDQPKYYPNFYNSATITSIAYNQHFIQQDIYSKTISNEDAAGIPYKLIINCTADGTDDFQRWYVSDENLRTVFSFTTPDTLDDLTSFKTYITAVQLVNYTDDATAGSGPATLYAAGKALDIKIEIAGITPYEDTWESASESDDVLISTNGGFTVPFYIVEDSPTGEDYIPFNGYIAIDIRFAK